MKCKLSAGFLKRERNCVWRTTELPVAGHAVSLDEVDPVTGPIREAIAAAREAGQLDYLLRVGIPHCVGILEGERAELVRLARDRMGQIKAAAGPVKVDQGCRAVFQGRKAINNRGHQTRRMYFKVNQG